MAHHRPDHPIENDPDLTLAEIMKRWPRTGPALLNMGLGCMGCAGAQFYTITTGAEAHGLDPQTLRRALLAAALTNAE